MSKQYFQDYVRLVNRIHLVEMIDDHRRQKSVAFRASLVSNPFSSRESVCKKDFDNVFGEDA